MIRPRSSYIVGAIISFVIPAAAFAAFVGPSDAPPSGNVPGVVWNRPAADPTNAQTGVEYNISGNARVGGDFYLDDSKALRIDSATGSWLNVGNWDEGGFTMNVIGDLRTETDGASEGKITAPRYCIGISCITSWPSSGMSTATADGRYVNVTGDTMTGGLTVTPGSGTAGTFNGQTWGVRGFGDTSGGFFRNEINTSYSANLGMNGYGGYFNAPSNQLSLYSTQNTQIAGKLGVGLDPDASTAKVQIQGSADPVMTLAANSPYNTAIHFLSSTAKVYMWVNRSNTNFNIGTPIKNPAFTIEYAGNVGIGTSNPTQPLSVNGSANKVGGGSWDTFSDERLKNIHGAYSRGLDDLMKLQPVWYEYLKDNPLELKSEGTHVGFSAQSVQKVIPEAVSKDDKGYLYLNNDPILWTMLNSIKELKAENDALKARLDRLEKKR